jgi:hypothetical protein
MIRHFVSYPKSGRTWIRYMLTQLGVEHNVQFHHDTFEFNDGSKPPHNFDLMERLERYSKVDRLVYLERDPRDVMASLYHQVTGRFQDFFGYHGNLAEFIRDDYFGAKNLRRFRDLWDEITRRMGFLKVTYEECHRDSVDVLRQIVDYFDFYFSQDKIVSAARNASFETMRAVELANTFPGAWLRPRNGFPKVRIGKVGGHADMFSVADIRYLSEVFGLDIQGP